MTTPALHNTLITTHQPPNTTNHHPPTALKPQTSAHDYAARFETLVQQTTFGRLHPAEQAFLRQQAQAYRFTQQELRQLSDMSLDRQQWREPRLADCWPHVTAADARQRKQRLLHTLHHLHQQLRVKPNDYATRPRHTPPTRRPDLKVEVKPQLGLGRCPVASEKTRCCNLLTLDAVEKCGFDCSYCSIQSFYHGDQVVFDQTFAAKLKRLKLDPAQTYHIGTGQSSDSLLWGNHQGVLAALCDFAAAHPNVILELKTKSNNIAYLLKNDYPPNILCTWSLNPQTIIDHEEHRTASLEQRLRAAAKIAAKGRLVGFHLHPIIHYHGWQAAYADIATRLCTRFTPAQVALVSLGTLTYAKSVLKSIRRRDFVSKILQMPMVESAGKYSYPLATKRELFTQVYQALGAWHGRVFFYLCMEAAELWQPLFGYDYATNLALEAAMKRAYLDKIAALPDASTTAPLPRAPNPQPVESHYV